MSPIRGAVRRVNPNIDRQVWQAHRLRACASEVPRLRKVARLAFQKSSSAQQPVHAVVVPHLGPHHASWAPAHGNYFFEAWRSLAAIIGDSSVTIVPAGGGEPHRAWQERIIEALGRTGATHLVIQPENDPNSGDAWNWDSLALGLRGHWDGPIIGVTWDSWYPWVGLRLRRLGRIAPHLLLVDFCEPMNGFVRSGRIEVGPVTMPMSPETVALIDERVSGIRKEHELSFIGALYDYRVALLDELRQLGVDVAVNPHRPDATTNYHESRSNQPGFLDYMAGIARSELTLNFSRAHEAENEQYKIRIQEAALVGTLPLTDDRDRTSLFFSPGQFERFDSLSDIARIVRARVSDPVRLRADQSAARERAHLLAATDFWGKVDDGLRARGLRPLTGLTAPPAPHR